VILLASRHRLNYPLEIHDTERFRLIGGPYCAPTFVIGDKHADETGWKQAGQSY
jgi:hypothetical protein